MPATKTDTGKSALPPGQRSIDWFPRIGVGLITPPPAVPANPVISIHGAAAEPVDFAIETLADLPRHSMVADFHCVAGFTVPQVHWEGVAFTEFYRIVIEPAIYPTVVVSHLVFRGLDRVDAVVQIEDALSDDVLLADTLDGEPLSADHGAPVRIVSPSQYGYMSVKHLCEIEVHASTPIEKGKKKVLDRVTDAHPRARVWQEERHRTAPAWLIRPIFRVLKVGMLLIARRNARRGDRQRMSDLAT